MAGVLSSRVGYTGGEAPNATYESVCSGDGHTEALCLTLDPNILPYETFLRRWLEDPRVPTFPNPRDKVQYRTAIFAQDARQAELARRLVAESGKAVPVEEAGEWYDAEEWHQHFYRDFKDFPT